MPCAVLLRMSSSSLRLESIRKLLEETHSKKENLRKAFEALETQATSSSLPLNNVTWSHLDSYFSSLHSSLLREFSLLLQQQQQQQQPSPPPPSDLTRLCESMDAVGIRRYMDAAHAAAAAAAGDNIIITRSSVNAEVPVALARAPYPSALVLGVIEGGGGDITPWCAVLLEELAKMRPEVSVAVKERAAGVAEAWKRKLAVSDRKERGDAVAFVLLVGVYGLADRFDAEEIFDWFVVVANRLFRFPELCQGLGLQDRVPDIVSKLIYQGKHTQAVRYIYAFGLTDKFPVVPILQDYLEYRKDLAQNCDQSKLSSLQLQYGALDSELEALRTVIKLVECYKLESEYPMEDLVNQLEMLQKKKRRAKRASSPRATVRARYYSKLQKLRENKHHLNASTDTAGPAL